MYDDRWQREPDAKLPKLDPMLLNQCQIILIEAINAFPECLARCEPEAATTIIADLIKTVLHHPEAADKGETLEDIMRQIAEERDDDDETEQEKGEQ